MKKKFVTSALLCTVGLVCGNQIFAATSADTEIDSEFLAGDRPDPSLPGGGDGDGSLDPDTDKDGNLKPLPELDNVYVTHLPSITFGSNKTESKTAEYNAKTEKRTFDGEEKTFYMPHSVQVSDLSGKATSKWQITVKQKAPFTSVIVEETPEEGEGSSKAAKKETPKKLENTRVRIYGNTLTNNSLTEDELKDKISGVQLSQEDASFGKHDVIPTTADGVDGLTVLSVKTPGGALNSYTSAIFVNDYKPTDYSVAKTPKSTSYDGIRLNVPASDKPEAKSYTAELEWELSLVP